MIVRRRPILPTMRRGAMLLEVVIAMAILVAALAAIGIPLGLLAGAVN